MQPTCYWYAITSHDMLFYVLGHRHPLPDLLGLVAYARIAPETSVSQRVIRGYRYYRYIDLLQPGGYDSYWREAKRIAPGYVYQDQFMGPVHRLKAQWVQEWANPINALLEMRSRSVKQRLWIEALSELLEVPVSSLGLTGTRSLCAGQARADVDVIVYGKARSQNAVAVIRNYLARCPEAQVLLPSGKHHNRRFVFRDKVVCPHFNYDRTDKFSAFTGNWRMISRGAVRATVLDSSESMFTPCVYWVRADNGLLATKVCRMVSWRPGHSMLLRDGDMVQFCGELLEPAGGNETNSSWVYRVPMRRPWIEVLQ